MPAALKRLLLVLIVFSPAIFTGKLVIEKSVDVGNWDQWENAPLMQKWHEGKLTWHDLYAPQIQHRIVIPRLIIIALTHLSGGDFRWENYATFAVFLTGAVLLFRLMLRTMGGTPWTHALMFMANILIFSPMQYQNLFWGSSLWMAIPMPCMIAILNLLYVRNENSDLQPKSTGPKLWWRFISIILVAEIATHSFAHGVLFWPIIVVFFLLQPSFASLRNRIIFAAITLVVGAGTITCYFHDFYNAAYHAYSLKPGDYAMETNLNLLNADDRAKFIGFFLAFLGTPFARTPFVDHPLAAAQSIGIFVLAAFVIVAALFVFTKTGRRQWREALPWLALAAYVIGVALAISKGRSAIGEHRAVTTRYLVISVFLPIASLALWYQFVRSWLREREASPALAPRMISACLLTAFAVMQIPQWSYGMHLTEVWYHARRQSQALVWFLPHLKLPDDSSARRAILNTLDKESANWHCLDAINTLNSLGLLKNKPLESPELKWFTEDKKALAPMKGDKKRSDRKADVEVAKFSEDGKMLEITGTARFAVGQPADAVLVTIGDKVIALGRPTPRALLRIYGLDYEFANVEETPVSVMYPWRAYVSAEALPPDNAKLEFWALDAARKRIAKIDAVLEVDAGKTTAKVVSP